MRLTLRTLLAYMDDILDPSDQEELGRKIESSPFATELIHRSRDAVRRLRLSAADPLAGSDDDIHGSDQNLDANTASEYLDNTLSPEGVADFERSCLEAGPNADMLLAEAASCHHVLTMVLGEPAEVDADLRQRMYALAQSPAAAQQLRVEPAHRAAMTGAPATAVAARAVVPTAAAAVRTPRLDQDEAGVPDYILAAAREQRRRTRRMASAFAAAMLLGGAAAFYFWPQGEVQIPDEVAQMGGVDKMSQGVEVGEEGPSSPAATTGDVNNESAEKKSAAESSEAPAFNASAASPAAPGEGSATTALPAPLAAAPGSATPPAAPAAAEIVAAAASGTAASASPTPPPVPAPATTEGPVMKLPGDSAPPITTNVTPPPGATPVPPAAAASIAAEKPTIPPQGEAAVGVKANPEAPAAAMAAKPKQIGSYLGNNDLLLQLIPAKGGWVRLAPRTGLVGGERLLALPAFRTHVVLADVNAYLSDGSEVEVIPASKAGGDAPADFGLRIPYGQVILNSGLNGNRIELSLMDEDRVVQLGPSSSMAIDVDRVFEPGGTAKREAAPAIVTWYLTSGTASWGDGKTAEAPATWITARGEDSAAAAIEKLPEWVDREPITENERRARDRVAQALTPGESVNTPLLELSDPSDRRPRTEDRALAALSGAYVGQYDALVRALGDVNQRASWKTQIEALRQAIARDPQAIEGIHKAFEAERGPAGADDLMEMLLGFDRVAVGTTRDEVKQGALVRILRWMNDDDLMHRVLASYDMNEITGTGNGTLNLGGYRPEHSADQRKRELRHYDQRLEAGELMPKDSPKP